MDNKSPFDNQRKIENLHHFNCSNCQKWWSISDAPEEKENWFCPWCGQENKFIASN